MTWGIVFYALVADIPNGGITNFFSQLVVSFGYTAEQSLLYATPGGAVEVITLVLGGYLGDRYGNRLLVSTFGLVCGIIGMREINCQCPTLNAHQLSWCVTRYETFANASQLF